MESWKQGLKAVAVYRDGCKRTQPLSTSKTDPGLGKAGAVAAAPVSGPPAAVRKKLPDERQSFTHKFSVAGHEGYVHVGMYETGEPGEIFVKMAREGSTISGLMDSFATAISLALQHGVPMRLLCDKFARTRFEPYGFTENPGDRRAAPRNGANGHKNGNGSAHTGNGNYSFIARTDAPTCPECGSIMIPNGSCHKCVNCGTTSGCS